MIDKLLKFQDKVKKIFKKWQAEKTIAAIQKLFNIQTYLLLLQSLVFVHLHYNSVLLSVINQNLILSLDKQINWALKPIIYQKETKIWNIAGNSIFEL